MFNFLEPVAERKDKQVTADARRFALVQPPPLPAQRLTVERPKAIELALDRSFTGSIHG